MNKIIATNILKLAQRNVGNGYAHALLTEILNGVVHDAVADSLFRTLVLDESWTVPDAKDVYSAAFFLTE